MNSNSALKTWHAWLDVLPWAFQKPSTTIEQAFRGAVQLRIPKGMAGDFIRKKLKSLNLPVSPKLIEIQQKTYLKF